MVQRETGANWQEKLQVMIGWVQYNTSLGPNQLHHREVCSKFYLWDLISSTNDRGIYSKKVQVGKDQEKAQSEKDSHSKNRGGKKPN